MNLKGSDVSFVYPSALCGETLTSFVSSDVKAHQAEIKARTDPGLQINKLVTD